MAIVMSLDEAEEARSKFFETYSGVKQWQDRQITEMSFTVQHFFHNCIYGTFALPPYPHIHRSGQEKSLAKVRNRDKGIKVSALQYTVPGNRSGSYQAGNVRIV